MQRFILFHISCALFLLSCDVSRTPQDSYTKALSHGTAVVLNLTSSSIMNMNNPEIGKRVSYMLH